MDEKENIKSTWNKLASLYEEKFMDLDIYNQTYRLFCDLLPAGASVFEIGCGPGNITQHILQLRPDIQIRATDFAPNMVKLAQKNNPIAQVDILDCRDIKGIENKFDAIIIGFCMPYLSKEECIQLICDCKSLLNKSGILYFSVIEDDYSKSRLEMSSNGEHRMFVYYHQQDYLLVALKENNLTLIESIKINYPKNDNKSEAHRIFIAANE